MIHRVTAFTCFCPLYAIPTSLLFLWKFYIISIVRSCDAAYTMYVPIISFFAARAMYKHTIYVNVLNNLSIH